MLGGFEEEPAPPEPGAAKAETAPEEPWLELAGSVETSLSVNYLDHRSPSGTDYGGLQRFRNRLNLELDLSLPREWQARLSGFGFYDAAYALNGRKDYTHNVRNEYEWDAEVLETWIRGPVLSGLDLKLGRQIVIWGRSDTIRVLDVLNPLDNREPGRVDLEDLRRPVGMARLDGYRGDWTFTALAIPEIRFDQGPVAGSDFDFAPDLSAGGLTLPGVSTRIELQESVPDDFESWEFAGAATGTFRGWDVSLHGAWFWNDQPHLVNSGLASDRIALGPLAAGLRRDHARLWLVGAGGNYAFGSWLVKGEAAFLEGIRFCDLRIDLAAASAACRGAEKARIDGLLGVEYYGLRDTTLALEVAGRRLLGFEPELRGPGDLARRTSEEIALRATRSFWNETLQVTLLAVILGWHEQDGSIVRLSADYDLRDALVLGGGILLYQEGGAAPLSAWGRNDRLFFSLKWSF